MFLKISQISQENTCVGVTGVFLWNLRKFLRTRFFKNISGGCFWSANVAVLILADNKSQIYVSGSKYDAYKQFRINKFELN